MSLSVSWFICSLTPKEKRNGASITRGPFLTGINSLVLLGGILTLNFLLYILLVHEKIDVLSADLKVWRFAFYCINIYF